MHTKPSILFLYTELAGYTLACMKILAEKGVNVHVVRYPVNTEAPFVFDGGELVRFYDRKKYDLTRLLELTKELDPSLIVCSGWIDKDYLAVCRSFSGKCKTMLAFDNKWEGTVKQVFASIIGKVAITKYFKYAWVPGSKQRKYAHKLGFAEEKILDGFYACDHDLFDKILKRIEGAKEKKFPKRFIYSGRYYGFKGVSELWDAFVELKKESKNDWELFCIGSGDETPRQHASIKHFGFVQPEKLETLMADTGVFVMPSRKEPWGVALHEFAAAGFPLICSDQVGAAEAFLEEGRNGYSFPAGNKEALKDRMRKIMGTPQEELIKMGKISAQLSKKITPATWAETVFTIINK